MLNADEVEELSLHFKFVGSELLMCEILADLTKRKEDRLPEDVVSALATKMWTAHGLRPADSRKLVWTNLCGNDVPMNGCVPVDPDASNVYVTPDGKGMLYDSLPEQDLWAKWSAADFALEDRASGVAWRQHLETLDLLRIRTDWQEFVNVRLGRPRSLDELLTKVDNYIESFRASDQAEIAKLALDISEAPDVVRVFVAGLMAAGLIPRIKDVAPYAASVAKLYLFFVCGVARGFLGGVRNSCLIDLQYLFYAPFCMVFISGDKLQRDLWKAVSGRNTFVWAIDMKKELVSRVEARKTGLRFPDEGSLIVALWKTYLRITHPDENSSNEVPKTLTVDELAPEIRDQFKAASEQFRRMQRTR